MLRPGVLKTATWCLCRVRTGGFYVRRRFSHPGAVALQDGGWIRIDEETGIDLGGDPNILQAPKASGQASQSWTGTLVQVEKYDGPLTLEPDKYTPIVMPLGMEE